MDLVRIISCLLFLCFVSPTQGFSSESSSTKSNTTYEEIQHNFFSFVANLYLWASNAKSTQPVEASHREILNTFGIKNRSLLESFFTSYAETRRLMRKVDKLNIYDDNELIPEEFHNFILQHFALENKKETLTGFDFLEKIVGPRYEYADGTVRNIIGFLPLVENFPITEWKPIKTFLKNFNATLLQDPRLSAMYGRSLAPILEHYFNYMHPRNKLRVFHNIVDEYEKLSIGEKKHFTERMTVRIFQAAGPIMVKLMQELQEEIKETDKPTFISIVLKGLRKGKAITPVKADKLAKEELRKLLHNDRLKGFELKKTLGVASIAQTFLFTYENKNYVIKIQKPGVDTNFELERESLQKLLTEVSGFDKGMKQKFKNIASGIDEELDFSFERKNLKMGKSFYNNDSKRIYAVEMPELFYNGKTEPSSKILIMDVAKGESVDDVIERKNPAELKKLYTAMTRLYQHYIETAFRGFFHGDLHRGNIFYDLLKDITTIIDFGNAGELSKKMQTTILSMFNHAKVTMIKKSSLTEEDHEKIDVGISKLGHAIHAFLDEQIPASDRSNKRYVQDQFFKVCFDPKKSAVDRTAASRMLSEKRSEWLRLLNEKTMERKIVPSKEKELTPEIDSLQDDIDFLSALLNNCLNGSNTLIRELASQKLLLSEKLERLFRHLLRNGITMPTPIIFFTKSKALLEGILTIIAVSLHKQGQDFEYVEPDELFDHVLQKTTAS